MRSSKSRFVSRYDLAVTASSLPDWWPSIHLQQHIIWCYHRLESIEQRIWRQHSFRVHWMREAHESIEFSMSSPTCDRLCAARQITILFDLILIAYHDRMSIPYVYACNPHAFRIPQLGTIIVGFLLCFRSKGSRQPCSSIPSSVRMWLGEWLLRTHMMQSLAAAIPSIGLAKYDDRNH